MKRIDLHIERVVIDGLSAEGRHDPALREAIAAELSRLLAGEAGGLDRLRSAARIGGVTLEVGEGRPATLGAEIGGAIHRSLTP